MDWSKAELAKQIARNADLPEEHNGKREGEDEENDEQALSSGGSWLVWHWPSKVRGERFTCAREPSDT